MGSGRNGLIKDRDAVSCIFTLHNISYAKEKSASVIRQSKDKQPEKPK